MRCEIGPVSEESTDAWLRYAAEVLDHLAAADPPVQTVEDLDRLRDVLVEWRHALVPGHPFLWEDDRSVEELEFLMKALYEIGLYAEAEHEAGRMKLRPAEADEFHVQIVQQVLSQLEAESPASAHFVGEIRNVWGIAARE